MQGYRNFKVKIKTVIGSHAFQKGVFDQRMNFPFNKEYSDSDKKVYGMRISECYERGRLFASVIPKDLKTKIGTKVPNEIIKLYAHHRKIGDIL